MGSLKFEPPVTSCRLLPAPRVYPSAFHALWLSLQRNVPFRSTLTGRLPPGAVPRAVSPAQGRQAGGRRRAPGRWRGGAGTARRARGAGTGRSLGAAPLCSVPLCATSSSGAPSSALAACGQFVKGLLVPYSFFLGLLFSKWDPPLHASPPPGPGGRKSGKCQCLLPHPRRRLRRAPAPLLLQEAS